MARIRWPVVAKVFILSLASFNAGVNFGVFSPVLPDLQHLTSTTSQEISAVFSALGASMLLGGLTIGPLFNRCNGILLLGVLCLLQAGFLAMLGLFQSLTTVIAVTVGVVLTNTGIFTGCQTMALVVMPEYRAPLVQSMNLFHAVALAVAPLVMSPFLGDYREITPAYINITTISPTIGGPGDYGGLGGPGGPSQMELAPSTYMGNTSKDSLDQLTTGWDILKIEWGFLAIAAFDVATALVCFIWSGYECIQNKRIQSGLMVVVENPHDQRYYRSEVQGVTLCNRLKLLCKQRCSGAILCVFISIAFFGTISGIKFVLLVNYLYTFLNQYLQWSPDQATTLLSGFEFARFGCSFLVVPVSQVISPRNLLISDMTLMSIASTIMLVTINTGHAAFWVCIMLMALGSASVAGTIATLAAESVPFDSGSLVGLSYGTGGISQIVFPPLVAFLLETYGSLAFPAMLLGSSLVAVAPLVSWLLSARAVRKHATVMTEDYKDLQAEIICDEHSPLIADDNE